MELLEAKIVAIITLTMGSMLVGLLPAWFSTYSRNRYPMFLSCLLCFGSGVLLSTSLVHMLPEIRETIPKDYSSYAEVLFACGFFLLYAIDELVHVIVPHPTHAPRFETVAPGPSRNASHHRFYNSTETRPLLEPQPAFNPNFIQHVTEEHRSPIETPPLCHHPSQVGSVGMLCALIVHAVLEGLAVGLETSSTQVLLLFGAIASHKLVVTFCLGVQVAAEHSVLQHFVYIIIFSFGSPLGIGLGMIFMDIPKDISSYLLPVLQGLAGGTLFYVSVLEVLALERSRWANIRRSAGFYQFFCVAIGFTIMTVLNKYMDV